jgi:hypothetical protein
VQHRLFHHRQKDQCHRDTQSTYRDTGNLEVNNSAGCTGKLLSNSVYLNR